MQAKSTECSSPLSSGIALIQHSSTHGLGTRALIYYFRFLNASFRSVCRLLKRHLTTIDEQMPHVQFAFPADRRQ